MRWIQATVSHDWAGPTTTPAHWDYEEDIYNDFSFNFSGHDCHDYHDYDMPAEQCCGQTRANQQCRNMTTFGGGYCWIHKYQKPPPEPPPPFTTAGKCNFTEVGC